MAVIGLAGPHAIGKTTAVERWVGKYRGLTAALCDNQYEMTQAGKVRVNNWNGTEAEKEELVVQHRERLGVTVIESARTTCLNFFLPGEPVIFLVCSWQRMREHMVARSAVTGKPFRSDYWHPKRIEAECKTRYVNWARKHLPTNQYRIFEIDNYDIDWPPVDEYFGSLYRPLNNLMVRERERLGIPL